MEQEYTTTQVEKLPPSNTEEVINLDENGQVLLDKQMDEIKVDWRKLGNRIAIRIHRPDEQ